MSALMCVAWGALGAAAFWLLVVLACVIWFGLSRWADADDRGAP